MPPGHNRPVRARYYRDRDRRAAFIGQNIHQFGEIDGQVIRQGPDPKALAAHWGAVCGIDPVIVDGEPAIRLAHADLRFVPDTDGRGPGLGGIDVVATDKKQLIDNARTHGCLTGDGPITLCGTRINIVEGRA